MAASLLLLYVTYLAAITASLGRVTLPSSDILGKVTPVKPKPLTASSIPIPGLPREVLTKLPCNSEDIIPKLLSPAQDRSVFREFSSRLELKTTSRPLPVPKIDTSILNENFSKRFPKKSSTVKPISPPLISPSSAPIIGNTGSDICVPETAVLFQSPYVSTLISPPSLPLSSSDEPNIRPLSTVPFEPFIKGDDPFSSIQITSLPSVTPSFYSPVLNPELPLLKARKLLSREFSAYDTSFNTNLPPYSTTLLYPLYYNPMYLPIVRTPDMEPTNYPYPVPRPIAQSQPTPLNVLSPPFINPFSNTNSASIIGYPLAPNLVKTSEIPKPMNSVLKPVSFLNTDVKNPWLPLDTDSHSVVLESNTVKPPCLVSLTDLKDGMNPTPLLTPIPIIAEGSTDIASTMIPKIPLMPPKISTAVKPSLSPSLPLNFLRTPSLPILPTTAPLGVFPNYISNFDIAIESSRNLYKSDSLPIVDTFVQTTDTINTDDLINNLQARINFNCVPNLNQINVPEIFPIPLLPEISAYQIPNSKIKQYVTNMPVILPPTTTDLSSRISQISTPSISYINVSPSSVSQCTSNMVSSINDIVSNMAQSILSTVNSEYISKCLPTNPYKSKAAPIDSVAYINTPLMDSLITSSLDIPISLAASTIQLLPTPPLKTTIVPLVSPNSFLPPRFCPSYLPSPALPSCTSISSPCYMEPPVLKVSSSNKDTKDVDKMLELMILADFLSGEDNIELDDIDKLLALLSVR